MRYRSKAQGNEKINGINNKQQEQQPNSTRRRRRERASERTDSD